MGMPLPKAGVFAHHEGEAVARTIASQISGEGRPGSFDGQGACFIEVGGGKAGFGRGNFYAEPTPTDQAPQAQSVLACRQGYFLRRTGC